MRHAAYIAIVFVALSIASIDVPAQQLKIESQGQAEQASQQAAAIARRMTLAIGEPAAGMGQVVLYRSMTSPGDAIPVTADGAPAGRVGAGMYIAIPASPGTHPYGPGSLQVPIKAGDTKYVQVIRDRTGMPRLLASNATKFQAAARQSN